MAHDGTPEPAIFFLSKICGPVIEHHLRSIRTSIKPSSHPEPASHQRSLSEPQWMRERGERSPSCCSSEEGQHWRQPVWSIKTSTNNKSLQTYISKAYFVCLTPDEGSLAQTWWYLFSGSKGSSSTKPEMLYLLTKMGWDLKTTTNSQHSPLLPGDISIGIAPSHHNGLPIRNAAGTSSTMAQLKGFATWELFLCYWKLIPGTISAVSLSAFVSPPSRTMESRGDGGVHAVWYLLPLLLVK